MHGVMRPAGLRFALLAVLLCSPLPASTITLTDPAAGYFAASSGPCWPGNWQGCGAYGYLGYSNTLGVTSSFLQSAGAENFLSAFANWNAAQPSGSQWTLAAGGALAGLDLAISRFNTFANNSGGGVDIFVGVSAAGGYAGPALDTLYWAQALLINYTPGTSDPNSSQNTMDDYQFNIHSVPAGGCRQAGAGAPPTLYCGPVYPFQSPGRDFADRPSGIYPLDSFRGIALLTTADPATRTLTWYDGGVNYGFDVFVVPEPATWFLTGAALLVLLRRRLSRGSGSASTASPPAARPPARLRRCTTGRPWPRPAARC